MKLFISRVRLFIHLLPNSILYLTLLSLALIVVVDIMELRFPYETPHAEKINLFWVNTLYAVFTSGLFFIIVFGTLEYRKATRVAPYIISVIRELIGHIQGGLYSICNAVGIKYESKEYPSIEIFEKLAALDFTMESNEGRGVIVKENGEHQIMVKLNWYEAFEGKNEKVLELCNSSIDNINNLNFPDNELLRQLYYIKTSPFISAMSDQAKSLYQLNRFAVYADWYYDFIISSFQLEAFLNRYYSNHPISIERPNSKNQKIEEILKQTKTVLRKGPASNQQSRIVS